jgi:hypothetical protein
MARVEQIAAGNLAAILQGTASGATAALRALILSNDLRTVGQFDPANHAPNNAGTSREMIDSIIEATPGLASRGSMRGVNTPGVNLAAAELAMQRRIGSERDPVRRDQLQRDLANFRQANNLGTPNISGGPNAEFRAVLPPLVTNPKLPNAIMPELNSASMQATLAQNGWTTVGSGVSKNGSFVRMQSGSTSITFYTSTSGGGVPTALVFQNGQPTLKIRLGGSTPPAPNGKGGNP